jgi:hypothetical protein
VNRKSSVYDEDVYADDAESGSLLLDQYTLFSLEVNTNKKKKMKCTP